LEAKTYRREKKIGGKKIALPSEPAEIAGIELRAARRRGYTGGPRNPDRTSRAILDAATEEFATRGIGSARVDAIAERAGVNKRMLYHYFSNKQGLYLAVLENAYAEIRNAELGLQLDETPPEEGIRLLARFTWSYFLAQPHFLSLLATENLHRARHLKASTTILTMHSAFVDRMKSVLERGAAEGRFKKGLDPIEVYLAIASLGGFYLNNRFTLSTIFKRDLAAPERLEKWGRTIEEIIVDYVKA
jgi:AcrR family transcriptional regulator